jgi:AcrR family transcriptional regulator
VNFPEQPDTESQRSRTNRVPPAQVRSRIMDAALHTWARKGVEGASLDEVAAAAGFTKGAVYSRFKNKNDLFFALLEERVLDRIKTLLAMDVPVRGTVAEQIEALGDALYDALTTDSDWQILFLEFWGRAVREPEAHRRYTAVRTVVHRHIADFIREETARRGARCLLPVDQVVVSVLALANGLFIEQAPWEAAVPRELMGKLLSMLVEPIDESTGG